MITHLHLHSHFSFGLGVSSPDELARAAAKRGYRTLACTDTNGVYGAVEFQRACDAAGVRPILGAHLIAGGEEVVALAMNERGWGALCRAITAIHWASNVVTLRERSDRGDQSSNGPPPLRFAQGDKLLLSGILGNDRDGLILLSRDVRLLEGVLHLSGPANLYAELRPGKRRHATLAAARRLGLPVVATNGVVAAQAEDWGRHRLLRAIALNTTLSLMPSEEVWPSGAWLCEADDLTRHFPDCPEAIRATQEIAERCEYTIPVGGRIVPPRVADTGSAFAQLRELTLEGARQRYPELTPELQSRLDLELGIIAQKGFADYFLVVRDIVRHGPTHCGRGSVANSVVSYCLGITHVDPIRSNLVFERFLNLERRDPPDIDLDFPWDERDKVLAYVFRQYPRLHSAMVANHNCFQSRGALREVAKVHGRPAGEIREVTRRIPFYEDGDRQLPDVIATHPNFRVLNLAANWQEFARIAETLVGIPRHLSVHAGGVVITPTPLTDYVPVERAAKTLEGVGGACPEPFASAQGKLREGVPVIQFEKDGTEDAGLVKIDLLGNRSLAVIRDAIEAVHGHTAHRIDYTSSTAGNDEGAKALFRTGQTMGVFYTESPASRLLCTKSRADTFELLVLNTSMIRPASNRYIRLYLERLREGAPYEPLDPCLRDTLLESFGIMVYQEDVVNVCTTFAGMSPATGDGLRKALSKKRPTKHLAGYAEEFFTGARRLGRDAKAAKRVWEMIMSFAGYSFCKGHSCSYIQVAQHACALRANHPAEFMAAVLSNGGGFYQPFAYVAEAMRMGLTVLPPDVNASDFRCTGKGREIRIGLQYVKGLSADGVERVLASRGGQADGRTGGRAERPFTSIFDLRARTGLDHSDLRLLIKVGALDSIAGSWTRPMMLWLVDSAGQRESGAARQLQENQPGHRHPEPFDCAQGRLREEPAPSQQARGAETPLDNWFCHLPAAVPILKEYSSERRRREEYEILGFITDSHPMQLHRERLREFRLCPSPDLNRYVGQHVLAAGMLTTAKPVHTVKDEPMEFVTFDDGHGLIEAVLFPQVYREHGHVLFDQGPFIFRGKVEEEFGAVTLTLTHLDRLERVRNHKEVKGQASRVKSVYHRRSGQDSALETPDPVL